MAAEGEEIDRELLAAQFFEMDEDVVALNQAPKKKGKKRKRAPKGTTATTEPTVAAGIEDANPPIAKDASPAVDIAAGEKRNDAPIDDEIGPEMDAKGIPFSGGDFQGGLSPIHVSTTDSPPRTVMEVNANLVTPYNRDDRDPDGRPRPGSRQPDPKSSRDTTVRDVSKMRRVVDISDLNRLANEDAEDLEEYALHNLLVGGHLLMGQV